MLTSFVSNHIWLWNTFGFKFIEIQWHFLGPVGIHFGKLFLGLVYGLYIIFLFGMITNLNPVKSNNGGGGGVKKSNSAFGIFEIQVNFINWIIFFITLQVSVLTNVQTLWREDKLLRFIEAAQLKIVTNTFIQFSSICQLWMS